MVYPLVVVVVRLCALCALCGLFHSSDDEVIVALTGYPPPPPSPPSLPVGLMLISFAVMLVAGPVYQLPCVFGDPSAHSPSPSTGCEIADWDSDRRDRWFRWRSGNIRSMQMLACLSCRPPQPIVLRRSRS